jgi:hypothetical protein
MCGQSRSTFLPAGHRTVPGRHCLSHFASIKINEIRAPGPGHFIAPADHGHIFIRFASRNPLSAPGLAMIFGLYTP